MQIIIGDSYSVFGAILRHTCTLYTVQRLERLPMRGRGQGPFTPDAHIIYRGAYDNLQRPKQKIVCYHFYVLCALVVRWLHTHAFDNTRESISFLSICKWPLSPVSYVEAFTCTRTTSMIKCLCLRDVWNSAISRGYGVWRNVAIEIHNMYVNRDITSFSHSPLFLHSIALHSFLPSFIPYFIPSFLHSCIPSFITFLLLSFTLGTLYAIWMKEAKKERKKEVRKEERNEWRNEGKKAGMK